MTYFTFVFFTSLNLPPRMKRQHPPICSAPCIVSTNYWLIVAFCTKRRPPKANPTPISLFFDVSCFVAPNKGTSCRHCKPSAGRLQQTYRSIGAMIWGCRCPINGERAKPLDRVAAAAHFDCCVLCVCLWLCFVRGSNF